MPITVNTPDGGSVQFPDGTSPDVMQNALRQKFGQPSPEAQAQSSHDAAAQAGLQAGQDESPLLAGISQAATQATFGGQHYLNALTRSVAQRLAGNQNPDSFADNLEYSRSKSAGEAAGHPIAATVGGVAGSVLGGGAIGKGLQVAGRVAPAVARVASILQPQSGQAVANVAKSMLVNGAVSGGAALASGDDPLTAGRQAAVGAVAGPVVGKVAQKAIQWGTPVAARAMQTLAKSIDETPATLQAAYQAFNHVTGSNPSMAQLADLKARGQLRSLAEANPEIGAAAIQAADGGGAPLHEQLQALSAAQTNPQSAGGILDLRDRNMNDIMSNPAPTTGNMSLADAPVRLNQRATDVLTDPLIARALRPDTGVSNSMFSPGDLHQRIVADDLTVGDLDHIRLQLRNQQKVNDSATAGINRNPEVAKAFGAAANAVEGIAASQHPAYGNALNQYRQVSRYATGFQHGLDGGTLTDADGDVARDLNHRSGVGQAGYTHGQALAVGQQALDAIAPGSVRPQPEADAMTGVKVAHAVASPGLLSVAGIMNHLSGTAMPARAQRVVATQLFSKDPQIVQQGIANLGRARVSSDQMRQLAGVIGGVAADKITAHLDNRSDQAGQVANALGQ